MGNKNSIRQANSNLTNAREAVREFYKGVEQPDMELVLFFLSVVMIEGTITFVLFKKQMRTTV
ncbi:Uncharacterised protein [Legionella hackeliae]|uniref:Uncharacterized protein n=1 Tax=Legionella hackeliae TaxID=449 RepID=A0A0A8UW52_LEGHA|nr:hypothetical protein Lhac_2311 [Legionella hackeliae]CEK11756.1 protein of unknown function [Legionella hackeliae]STX48527.1 Uncharacterised protein [Legionella hackeliae]